MDIKCFSKLLFVLVLYVDVLRKVFKSRTITTCFCRGKCLLTPELTDLSRSKYQQKLNNPRERGVLIPHDKLSMEKT